VSTKVFNRIGIQPVANRVINFMSEHDFGADHIGIKDVRKSIGLNRIKLSSKKMQSLNRSDPRESGMANGHNSYKRFMQVILDDVDCNEDFLYLFGL